MNTLTGQGIDRVDGRLKVTGGAIYAVDTPVSKLAYAVIVGSPIAAGRISGVEIDAARHSPGVLAVLTHENAPRLPGALSKTQPNDRLLQVLQDDVIHYDGQPVALVVAETLDQARHAARAVVLRYEAGSHPLVQLADEPQRYAPKKLVRDPTDSNRGNFDDAFATAAVRVDQTYTTPTQTHNPIELHGTVAVWPAPDRLTLYDATQGIFIVKQKLAHVFGIPGENVRVISSFLGGGFGCKGSPWSHVPLCAMAAKVTGRPVKLVLTRPQMFLFVGHRPETSQHVSLGAERDGKLVAVRHEVVSCTSRFDEYVEGCAVVSRSVYSCPNVRTSHRLARLDIGTPTFMRAPGESTGNFALESAMDELSYALTMDPLALRLKNYAERNEDKDQPWSSKSLRQCYERGAREFGWAKRRLGVQSMRDGAVFIGQGMATATYPAHQSDASASATIRADASAIVRSGTEDIGTGTYTVMTQVAADALAVPVERVRFELGDTQFPVAPLSAGSQTAASVSPAVHQACVEARRKLADLATNDPQSPLHGLATTDVDAENATLFSRRNRALRDPYTEILKRNHRNEVTATAQAKEKEDRKDFGLRAFGAQFAEVRFDPRLGTVRVSRLVGVFSAGTILNEKTARSQLMGGMVWGIGFALLEHTVRDARDGRLVVRDLADYHVASNADVHDVKVIIVPESDAHVNDLGVKGVGELGLTGAVAAIANAVYHATGKRIRDLPITPDKLV